MSATSARPAPVLGKAVEIKWAGPVVGAHGGDVGITTFDDIPVVEEVPLPDGSFPALLLEHAATITPYCLDLANGRIILVQVPAEDWQLNSRTFVYQSQREKMTRAFGVPLAEYLGVVSTALLDAAAAEAALAKTVVVHSTGRCGSTLFSALLSSYSGVLELSEADVFTSIRVTMAMAPGALDDATVTLLLRCVTLHHVHNFLLNKPDTAVIVFKTRSFAIFLGELLKAAVPQAKTIYLYRHAIDVIDSFGAAFDLDSPEARAFFPVIAPLMLDPRFAESVKDSPVGAMGLGWLSTMDAALKLRAAGILDATLTYEDLIANPAGVLKKVASIIGVADQKFSKERLEEVLGRDAHGDSSTKSTRAPGEAYVYLKDDQIEAIRAAIALHEEIAKPEFTFPDSLRAD